MIFTLLAPLEFIGYILDELAQMDFILNPHKSSVIVRGAGSRFVHWKRKHIYANKHRTKCLHLVTATDTISIPVQKSVSILVASCLMIILKCKT